ncbi:MAG TPA: protein-L-isoaspartate(D-aspartate) O-methyltransferase, partial [Candidatus Omnitrophota bacterium]|nr:protein-L-isoaspartate(D-aspartate) O-methyltransferase [Candidatus Omnitrophota bacterium]
LPIGHDQTISQPYIVAYMTQAALLRSTDKVLEIGTGSGYQAAVLAEMVEKVYTIEIVPELAEESAQRLKSLGYENIFVRCGDGYQGWPEEAPFDAIIVTAAPATVPEELVRQLKIGGRMIVPVGSMEQELIRLIKTQEGVRKESLLPVRFVPMVHGDQ